MKVISSVFNVLADSFHIRGQQKEPYAGVDVSLRRVASLLLVRRRFASATSEMWQRVWMHRKNAYRGGGEWDTTRRRACSFKHWCLTTGERKTNPEFLTVLLRTRLRESATADMWEPPSGSAPTPRIQVVT